MNDFRVDNMAGGVLNIDGGPRIIAVGGSAVGDNTTTNAVREYDPIADTITVLTSDPWPGNDTGDKLPGGFAVYNNKLYILGGFQLNIDMLDTIWEFDPSQPAGFRWQQKSAHLGEHLGYVPATTIGNYIYTAGGSSGGVPNLYDTNNVYRYDPVADELITITNTGFDATGETRALTLDGKMWVLGGGRSNPELSNQVQVYDPVAGTWSRRTAFITGRRNFPADTDGFNIWLVGGYASSSPIETMETYSPGISCYVTATSTATPSTTPTLTSSVTATPTSPTATTTSTSVPTLTRTPLVPTFTRTPTISPTGIPTTTPSPTPTRTQTPTSTPTNINAFGHFSPAGPQTITVGSRIDLDLMINSGSNNVGAAQSYLTFTNSILRVVNSSQPGCVVTNTVTADTTIFDGVFQNEVCNGNSPCDFGRIIDPPASISFASGALNNSAYNGDFSVAHVSFCATAVGDAIVHWQFSPPAPIDRGSEISDDNIDTVSNPTLYSEYVIHVIPASSVQIVGHVVWQGPPAQPNTRQQLSITVTLCVGGSPVGYGATTDPSGFFTVTTNLSPGSYNWRAKGPRYLATAGAVQLTSGASVQVEMGVQRAGDTDPAHNNTVNITDFNVLKGVFGQASSVGDLNNDAVTNVTDFNLLKGNFGTAGSAVNCP